MKKCLQCKKELSRDEVGLNKKLLGRNTKQFLCIECLGTYLNTDTEILHQKIVQFKEEGCTLF